MDEEDKQYKEKMKNTANKFSEAAKDKAKKEIIKKVITVLGVKGVAILILVITAISFLTVVFFAAAIYIEGLSRKEEASTAKEAAIGNEALNTILTMEDNKYKIIYNEKAGRDAIEEILEDNGLEHEDFTSDEIECLYKCLKAEWATTYPNLGGKVDNADLDSEYVQGVITIKRGNLDGSLIDLKYKPYEEFTNIKDEDALKYFSIKDGSLVIANWSSNEIIYTPSDSMPDDIKSQYVNTGEQISITETAINYRTMIGIHTVPFEFLLSLLVNTEDVDFVNDLADTAFDSTIEITIYDNVTEITTEETEHTNEITTYKKWVDYYITTSLQEITVGGTIGHSESYNTYENNKEITSTEKKEVDYTLTTKRITKNNSYIVGLTNVSSWFADIKNEYNYLPQYGPEENLELGEPNTYGPTEQEMEDISTNDSEVVMFKNSRESMSTKVDSWNGATITTTQTCTITGARRQGTINGLYELTKNTSQTNEYKYESTTKQTSNTGKKFEEVYGEHTKAKAQLDHVSSWLFELLEDSSSTVDYVSVMKYLLYICTGDNYGVTEDDILDLIELYNVEEFYSIATNISGNVLYDYIRTWENISLYKYYKRLSSTCSYANGDYYTIYMEGSISNIAYGIVLNKGWNAPYFAEYGVDSKTLKSYTTQGQAFTELTGKQIEEIYDKILKEKRKEVESLVSSLNLEEYQINALTSISYQYGNIGNFIDAYQTYYINGEYKKFQENFKDSTGYQPLLTTNTNNKEGCVSNRVIANWNLFNEGIYDGNGIILNPKEYVNNGELISYALSFVGKTGEEMSKGILSPYSGEWCAKFVSVCYDTCGLIPGVLDKQYTSCSAIVKHGIENGHFKLRTSGYIPKAGDLILYDWNGNLIGNNADHVGIVTNCDGTYVYTVEGNIGNGGKWESRVVGTKQRTLEYSYIKGYYSISE